MISRVIDSPIGLLELQAKDDKLYKVNWHHQHSPEARKYYETEAAHPDSQSSVLEHAANELELYFKGQLRAFTTPCTLEGTVFQKRVWSVLKTIEWGETSTYKVVAEMLNQPSAARAVGTAIGKNPIPIFIPCHRVLGSNGSLTGFSGGLETKQILLALEHSQSDLVLG